MSSWRLLADIGGTNARFARSGPDGEISAHRNYSVSDFADFDSALRSYLIETESETPCGSAAICAAGPVLDGQVQLTNVPWRICEAATSQLLGNVPVRLINDLEAVALALPYLNRTDVRPIGDIREFPSGPPRMLALNVGTGFGAAAIFRMGDRWVTCPSEAGHMSLGAQNEAELALLAKGDSSKFMVEDALSGQGLVTLYRKQCYRQGTEIVAATAQEVFARAASNAAAEKLLRQFTIWLGRVAGDLALASAAWGGVFLTGGVIQGWCSVASSRLFRANFEAGGKMQERLRRTYTGVITRDDVSLLGLAFAPEG